MASALKPPNTSLVAVDVRHLGNTEYTGVAHYTFELLRAIRNEGRAQSFLLVSAGRRFSLPKELHAFPSYHIPFSNRLLSLLFFFRLKTFESFLPQQVEAIWLPNINTLYTKKPYVVTVHDTSFLHFPSFFSFFSRLRTRLSNTTTLLTSAVKLLTVSNTSKRHISEAYHIDPSGIIDIPLAVSDTFNPKKEAGDEAILRNYGIKKPYFLSLCTLEPRKNLESVLEAYTRIARKDVHLVLAGSSGWKTTLVGSETYIGYVREKDRPALLRGAIALVFPSFYEGFGLPVLEAIACGTPVITTTAGALPELSHPLITYLPPFRVDALESALRHATQPNKKPTQTVKTEIRRWSNVAKETLATLDQFFR